MAAIQQKGLAGLRRRFNQLRGARDHGCYLAPERIWDVWKVQRETWSHEYWLLRLELKAILKGE
jgi:hypothetical protein